MIVVILAYMLFKIIISKICVKLTFYYPEDESIKDVGVWAFDKDYTKSYKYANQKLFLETYLDNVMCCFLGINAFYQNKNEFHEFWSTFDNAFCSIFTIVCSILIIVFPIYGLIKICYG